MNDLKYFNTFVLRVLIKLRAYRIIKENLNSIRHYAPAINWKIISATKMPEEFIELLKDFLNYQVLSVYQALSESFILENVEKLDLKLVSKYQTLTLSFIEENLSLLYFPYILMYQEAVTESFIESKLDLLNETEWKIISKYRTLSETFMTTHIDSLNIRLLLKYQVFTYNFYLVTFKNHAEMAYKYLVNNKKLRLPENGFFTEANVISEFKDHIPFNWILRYVPLSEAFLEDNKCLIKVKILCKYQTLSEAFIAKYRYWLNWHYICKYQTLSESFMETYKEFLDYRMVSKYQTLTEPFIDTHIEKLNLEYITRYKSGLSEAFLRRHIAKLNPTLLVVYQENLMEVSPLDGLSAFDVMYKNESLFRMLAKYKQLTVQQLSEYSAVLDWDFISRYQVLSLEQLIEFKEKLNWALVSRFQDLITTTAFNNTNLTGYIEFKNLAIYQDLTGLDTWVLNNINGILNDSLELLYYYQTGITENTRESIGASFLT